MKYITLISLALALLLTLNSCSLVKTMAGANIDAEQFEYFRRAKTSEIQLANAQKLKQRLSSQPPIEQADISFYLSKDMLSQIIAQYNGMPGVLDSKNSYTIDSIGLKMNYGSAVVSFGMNAFNSEYNVNLKLNMDCLLTVEMQNSNLVTSIEPFNISPKATASGILKSTEEIIENLVKVNLSNLSKNFPPMKIPVTMESSFPIQGNKIILKDQVNVIVNNPQRSLNYSMKVKDLLIFENQMFVSLDILNVGVK